MDPTTRGLNTEPVGLSCLYILIWIN